MTRIKGTVRLTALGSVLIIFIVLMGAMFLYFSNRPKQVEYIYKQVTALFRPTSVNPPVLK